MNQTTPQTENHGDMLWTEQFNADGGPIFRCPICGRTIALCGPRYKLIRQGDFYAGHSAHITLKIFKAALEREIWPQSPQNHEMIEAWEEAGGGPPFTLSDVNAMPSNAD